MEIHPSVELTDDGSQTLRHPFFGDTYHSTHGAVSESLHVFIRNGFDACPKDRLRILEVGFGSGLNALLTLRQAEVAGKHVEYTAIELYPVAAERLVSLGYADDTMFRAIHDAPWGGKTDVTPRFSIKKREADLVSTTFDTIFDIIYFDAFAHDTQPEMWSTKVFEKLYRHTAQGGALVTYSSKGIVKRALREAGYEVVRLKGAPGKRHMVKAFKR